MSDHCSKKMMKMIMIIHENSMINFNENSSISDFITFGCDNYFEHLSFLENLINTYYLAC
jgi:hypothetical protein